jgi:hypothetical protein
MEMKIDGVIIDISDGNWQMYVALSIRAPLLVALAEQDN